MKVLIDHPAPFALAHGGFQIQIEQTKAALERVGVDVEYVRWWDETQKGQIIHYFGRPGGAYIDFAHAKGIKVVVGELLTGLGSRPASGRLLQKGLMLVTQKILPKSFWSRLGWETYHTGDAFVALTRWEGYLMRSMFDADPAKIHVIPNGVEDVFLSATTPAAASARGDHLICTAAIHPRKQVVELARAAAAAKVPVWIIGKPYSETDAYYLQFLEIQKQYPDFIRYEGGISDRAELARIYRHGRGFVLLSTMESLSLSALEAAACGLPLLVPHLPWAREYFGDQACYLELKTLDRDPAQLRSFYDRCPGLSAPAVKIYSWDEVAAQLVACYQSLLGSGNGGQVPASKALS
jgi:glycosyltransferase involved in cell wall biosynthesis